MSVELKSFQNKSGKEIKYISINGMVNAKGKSYSVGIGIKKCLAVLSHAEEIKELLK